MAGKQVTELDALPSFTDTSLLPVHNGAGLKKGTLTQLANYLGNKFSNPNLLINPDFRINQRGETSYTSAVAQTIRIVYSVDRWCLYGHSLTINSDKSVTITPTTYSDGALIQNLETPVDGDITVQVYAVGVSGTATVSVGPSDGSSTTEIGTLKNGLNTFTFSKGIKRLVIRVKSGTLTLKYAKVEQGAVATPFVAPDNSDELDKCLRYYEFGSLDTAPGLAIQPTVYIRTYVHPKRSNPTYNFAGSVSFEMNGTGKNLSLTYIGTDLNTECCTFKFKPSEATQYGLGFCKNFFYEIDAEIY